MFIRFRSVRSSPDTGPDSFVAVKVLSETLCVKVGVIAKGIPKAEIIGLVGIVFVVSKFIPPYCAAVQFCVPFSLKRALFPLKLREDLFAKEFDPLELGTRSEAHD